MVRVDERVARCFGLLRSEEFAPLLEYLRNCQAESLKKLVVADGNQIYRLQGEAAVFEEMLGLVERSGELIEKLRRPADRRGGAGLF